MDLSRLQKALIGAAKREPPSAAVPPFFARRVMARLNSAWPALRHWSGDLWQAAIPCSALAVVVAGWVYWSNSRPTTDWSEEFEHAVIVAAIEQESEQGW